MDLFFGICFFLFGLIFGSFLNVCIHRIPRGESVVFPSSACPACHQEIKAYDNIPVFSWLILGGRCRHCRTPITPRYAVVELLTGFFFLACYWEFGLSLAAIKFCTFSFLIIGLVFIDAEWKLLPDLLTIPGFFLGVVFSWFVPVDRLLSSLVPVFFRVPAMHGYIGRVLSVADSLFGAFVGAAFIFGVGFIYLQARGVEGMGFGDVKLMAMVGAFLGVKLTVFTIFTASLLGTIFGVGMIVSVWMSRTRRRMERNRESREVAKRRASQSAKMVYRFYQIPFGVFLGGMALFALFFGRTVLSWYWRLYL
jgi:leader peptidase (prepilin peptidase)/N-methyltransferase